MRYRPEYNPKVIGKNLKRLREAKGLSVKDVKEYLRLGTLQAVYKYESGNGYPQADTMFALMELYDADLHDIVDEYVEEAATKRYEQSVSFLNKTDFVVRDQGMDVLLTKVISLEEHKNKKIMRIKNIRIC